MKKGNPYEYLRTPCLEDSEPVATQSSWVITDGKEETITIFTTRLESGFWVYGYAVNWFNGRASVKPPSAEQGLFQSQREARLYAIGFMLLFGSYFQSQTLAALHAAKASCLQSELF